MWNLLTNISEVSKNLFAESTEAHIQDIDSR